MSEADVTKLLASQPAPDMPQDLQAKVSDAITAEASRRRDNSRPRRTAGGSTRPVAGDSTGSDVHRHAKGSVPGLPRPRSGTPWPAFELLVPRPREARSAA
jgi:hypothetical protein